MKKLYFYKPTVGIARSRAVALISCLDGYLGYFLIDPLLEPETIIHELQQLFIHSLTSPNDL